MIQSRWTKKKHKIQNDLTGFNSHERNLSPEEFFLFGLSWLVLSRRHFSWGSHPLRNRTALLDLFQAKQRFWILLRELSLKIKPDWEVTWGDFEVRHGRWEGGSGGRGHMCASGWLMLMYGRNQHNIIKRSILQLKINELVKKQNPVLLTSSWLHFI